MNPASRLRALAGCLDQAACLVVLVIGSAWIATLLGDASLDRMVVGSLVNMVVVVGLYMFVGMTGVFSFGHLAFMAIGAYTVGVLTIPSDMKEVLFRSMPSWLDELQLPFGAAVVVGGLVAAAVALVLSVPISRMAGLTAAIATLAILVTVHTVAGNWDQVTNGAQGMSAIPTNTTLTVALAAAVGAVAVAWLVKESRLGIQIQATREDPVASRAVGIRVGRERGIAFVLSAFVVGVGGGLFAQLQGNLSPDVFYLAPTFLTLAMLVVGGMTSLSGAVLGVLVISALREALRRIEVGDGLGPIPIPGRPGLMEVGLAVVMVLILVLRPSGLMNGRELSMGPLLRAGRRARKGDGGDAATAATPVPPVGGGGAA